MLVKEVLEKLYIFQQTTEGKVDYAQTFEYERYDRIPILHDLNYFKFMFVDVLELPYHKTTLLKEFETLAQHIEGLKPQTLMIRDFQSRNILIDPNARLSFIDYQSAMQGPAMYDVVSFLYQAKANFPEDFRKAMIDFYVNLHPDSQERAFLYESVGAVRLIRNLQVLGAYGFRGLVQRKSHFTASIAQGLKNLEETATEWKNLSAFPELQNLIATLKMPAVAQKIEKIIHFQ